MAAGQRILVVDDEPDLRDAVRLYLEMHGLCWLYSSFPCLGLNSQPLSAIAVKQATAFQVTNPVLTCQACGSLLLYQ